MAIHTFAAIYIGSYEVSLKIFEISARKNIRKIDYIRSRIELGRDAYSRGVIGYELVEALCDTLEQFTKIMKEYQVDGYEAYAAAALRDVSNELFILDQIRIRTGLTVHVLSNSEHRFISYKSVAMRSEFEELIKTGAAVVDVGGGGMQITIFSKGKVITTQHLGLGTIRMQEQLAKKSCSLEQYELQIEELVEKELNVFMAMFTEQVKVKNLIIIGDYIMEVAGKVTGKKHENLMETNDFLAFLDDLDKKTVEQISEELNLSNENDSLIIPYMIIFKCMARKMKAEKIWAPGVIVSDGIAYDYAQKHKLCKPVHDFDADVISAARNLSARYMSYSPHIDALTQMATLIFDTMKKIHGLGKSGFYFRWQQSCMTAESISVLQTDRCVPMTLLWRRKSSVLHIWNVRSWRIRFYTIPIRCRPMKILRVISAVRVMLSLQNFLQFYAYPMRWTAAISRNSKMCVQQ